jgi:adenine-specific DNA-methyltransferase
MQDDERRPKELRYPRNPDLDPQLVWRGKDEQDWSHLVGNTTPPCLPRQWAADRTLTLNS